MNNFDATTIAPDLANLPAQTPARETEDPILRPFAEWRAARAEGGDGEAVVAQETDAFWEMVNMTPTSLAGIAAVATVLWTLHGPGSDPGDEDFAEDVKDPLCAMIASIWRAASGRTGWPVEDFLQP